MKRDPELIRKLLLFFRDKPGAECIEIPPIDDYDDFVIQYHCVLLHDANFLRCEPVTSGSSNRVIKVLPFELTWDGHEFADRIFSESVWNRIRETISSKGGVLAFNVINQLAIKFSLEGVGL
jgi:hypothetical protein